MLRQDLLVNLLNIFMHSRPVDIVLGTRMVFNVWSVYRLCVWEPRVLAYKVYDIHSVAAGATIEPKVHHIVNGISDLWVFPIEIRLLGSEQGEEIFVRSGVIGPGAIGFAENLGPIIGRKRVACSVAAGLFPDIPGALWVG